MAQQFMQKNCLQLILVNFSLHYNRDNSYLFVNSKEMIKFKASDSEIVEDRFCLGNISKKISKSNMKRKQDCMDLFITLVLIIMLLQLMV